MVLTAKGIASGMPVAAFIAKESVMDWKVGSHGTTYGGNPVCLAAATATFDLIEGGLIANGVKVGNYIFSKISDCPSRFKIMCDVLGNGLTSGEHIVIG